MSYVSAVGVAKAGNKSKFENTGTFGAHRRPKVVGVSDDVAYASRLLARRARQEERRWKRSLSRKQRKSL